MGSAFWKGKGKEKEKIVKKLLHVFLEILQNPRSMNQKKNSKNQSWTKIDGLQNLFGLNLFMGVGKRKMVRCKICFKVEERDKLLVQKLDFLNKHSS